MVFHLLRRGQNLQEYPTLSRSRRFQKRRNNKRKIVFFSILGIFFFVILLSLIAFGNKERPEETSGDDEQLTIVEQNDETDEENNKSDSSSDAEQDESRGLYEFSDVGDIEVEQVPPTRDDVIEAFKADWPPSGTIQEGPHTTDYSDGSQDRIEIKRAVSYVTGIPEDDMIEWFVGNGGEQKVIATVSNREKTEYYRVYLDWIDGEGWKPTLNERITGYNE